MSINVFWFSGTGNSRYIAEALAEKLADCSIYAIAEVLQLDKIDVAETNIIVYPDYAFGIPNLVKEFIRKAPFISEQCIYSVVTLGGLTGGPHWIVNKLLSAKGTSLTGGWSIIMPGNYTPFYGAPPETKQQQQFAVATKRIPEITDIIANKKKHKREDSLLIGPLVGWLSDAFFTKNFHQEDKNFTAQDFCTGCGICAKVCPVNNIEIKDGRPVWLGHCEQCLACLHWCPEEAIQVGKRTIGRKRYHHPNYKAADFFMNNPQS